MDKNQSYSLIKDCFKDNNTINYDDFLEWIDKNKDISSLTKWLFEDNEQKKDEKIEIQIDEKNEVEVESCIFSIF